MCKKKIIGMWTKKIKISKTSEPFTIHDERFGEDTVCCNVSPIGRDILGGDSSIDTYDGYATITGNFTGDGYLFFHFFNHPDFFEDNDY